MKLVKASDLTEKQKKQIEENRIAEENRIQAIREQRQQREQRRRDAQAMSGGSGLLNRAREYNQENNNILPTRNNNNYLGHVDNVPTNGNRKISFQDAYITNARKERESYVKPVQDEISSEIRNYYTVSLGDEKKKKEKVNKVSDSSELAHFQKKLAIQEMANDPNQYWKYKDYIDEQLYNFRKEDAIREGQRQAEETNRGMEEGKYVSTITQYLGNQFGQGVEGFGMGLSNALDMGFAGANKLIDKDSKIGDTFLTSDKRKSEIKQLKDYYSQDIEDKGLQFAGKVSNQIGNQVPSMALNVLAPGYGLYALGTSAGGRKAIETLNDDNSNYLQALATGTIVGGTEYLTERMFSGNALTRGLNATPLDEMASNAVSKVGNPFLRRLAGLGMDVLGENAEELVSNVVERGTDALINGKDFGSLRELASEGGETLATTTATTLVMAMLGLGGETYHNANQIRMNRDSYNTSVKNVNLDTNNKAVKDLFNSANNKELTPMFSSEIFENSTDSYKVVEMNDGSKMLAINPDANIEEVNEQIRKMSNKQLEQITTPMDEDIAEGIRRTAENNYLREQENRTSLENSARNYTTSLSNQDMQNIQEVQNRLADRGIKSYFDENFFPGQSDDIGALYRLSRNEDGSYSREIVFNPYAKGDTIIQEMAVHELTHDIVASKTDVSQSMFDDVMNYLKQDTEYFDAVRDSVVNAYMQRYANSDVDVNSPDFKNMIDEELVAKTLQAKLGNQEFINKLHNDNRTLFQRFVDWINDKVESFKNRNNAEYKFWKDIQGKFIEAYKNSEFKPGKTSSELYSNDTNLPTTDNQGRTLSKGQQEYFKNSKVRDNNGNLLTVYHGTPVQERFTTFDRSKAGSNVQADFDGIYFTDSQSFGERFAHQQIPTGDSVLSTVRLGERGNLYEGYLNIQNPLNLNNLTEEQLQELYDYVKDEWKDIDPKESFINRWRIMNNGVNAQGIKFDLDLKKVQDAGYDGVIANLGEKNEVNGKYVNTGENEYIVFNSNQFKNIDNTNPTTNPDIRYSVDKPQGFDEYIANRVGKEGTRTSYKDLGLPGARQIQQVANQQENNYNELESEGMLNEQRTIPENNSGEEQRSLENLPTENEATDSRVKRITSRYQNGGRETTKATREAIKEQLLDSLPISKNKATNFVKEFLEKDIPIEDIKTFIERNSKLTTTTVNQEVQELRNRIWNTPIKLNDFVRRELQYEYGGLPRNLRYSENGLPVDTFYKELLETNPGWLDPEIANEGQEAIALVEFMQEVDAVDRKVTNFLTDTEIDELTQDLINTKIEYEQAMANVEYLDELDRTIGKQIKEAEKASFLSAKNKTQTTQPTQQTPILPTTNQQNPQKVEKALNELTQTEAPKQVLPTQNKISDNQNIAKVLSEPIEKQKPTQRTWAILKANFIDKGAVFEKIAQKTNNRELQAKWDATLSSGAKGQYAIGNDRYTYNNGQRTMQSKSLTSIMDEVGENTQLFSEYMYHQLNTDRMSLEERYGKENKPVFGDNVTAEMSREEVSRIEQEHPEFKQYAQDIYDFLDANKQELVDKGVISQETADYFKELYPHYVPIQRVDDSASFVTVPLDTRRTGINTPIRRATGGSRDISPLFQTIANQTLQTYRASARNSFGVELKNSLGQINQLIQDNSTSDVETILDNMTDEQQNTELLQKGTKGRNPTFTVFENGEKITYDINEDIYDALKPKNEILRKLDESKASNVIKKVSSFRRGIITEYNPLFSITNALKDAQDVLINSQHPAKTYAKVGEAYAQIINKGYWYNEYVQNGGEQNSYFSEGEFENLKKQTTGDKIKNVLSIPLEKISAINNVVEMSPRLAEYIASREAGASVETAMLDASRVTTNFKAGGDITKFLNRNGATFLNASVQGFQQQVRNIQEANMKGLKGWTNLALKYAVAGIPVLLLNNLIWDDDDDYEELQDYVKDNYYVVAKLPNGSFLRLPKGRTVATIQKIVSNADEFIKGDKVDLDSVAQQFWGDLKEDVTFAVDNLAPNNPIDNNIISPIVQVAQNRTWYGDDLVPTRLQDKPNAEQYDESTDSFSRWLGEKLNVSPYKINYLLDQYGGGVSDVLLPLGTKQAENNPIEDKFTTNPIMKNKYPGQFFEKFDELNIKNNSEKATNEDKLRYKYISSVRSEISNLYKEKREIQNSDDTDKVKKQKLEEVQSKINKLAKDSLNDIENLKVSGDTATIGGKEFYNKNGAWTKITDKDKIEGVSLKTYSDYQNKIAKVKDNTGESATSTDKMDILRNSNYSNKEKQAIYENTIGADDSKYNVLKNTGINIDTYLDYKSQKFASDETGAKKDKVFEYVNNSPMSYEQRLLTLGMEYSLSDAEQRRIVDIVANMGLTRDEQLQIFSKMKGFKVNGNNVTW